MRLQVHEDLHAIVLDFAKDGGRAKKRLKKAEVRPRPEHHRPPAHRQETALKIIPGAIPGGYSRYPGAQEMARE